ncbi:MAG: site-2 protease family protein [Christensenellaceae bacterium]|jgi:regulator of sigma E protease|nr:site-2 protease family protein [Christensenellaceae bacterium]
MGNINNLLLAFDLLGTLSAIGYVILAIALLLIMITIHEAGHYTFGKLLGFKIYEFAIGFGKPLYKKTKKNGEVFSIRMLPLGGYCAFGEDSPTDEKDPTAFNNQPPWKRLLVLFGGVLFNFLSAIIFAVILLTMIGYQRGINVTGDRTITTLNEDGSVKTEIRRGMAGDGDPVYNPDANPNFDPDAVSAFDFIPERFSPIYTDHYDDPNHPELITSTEVTNIHLITAVNGTDLTIIQTSSVNNTLKHFREGDDITLSILTPEGNTVFFTIENATTTQCEALFLTASYGIENDGVYHNFIGALAKSVPFSFELLWMILELLFKLITFQLPMEQIGGTVATISTMGDYLGEAAGMNFGAVVQQMLFFLVLISINLAAFNILPIPSLDGARIVFVIIEWIRGKPIDRKLEAKIHTIGIMCLFAFVIFADIYFAIGKLF